MSIRTLIRGIALLTALHMTAGLSLAAQPVADTSSSSYRLVGTVEGSPMTGAVIEDAAGIQTFYRLHERLPDGSECFKVRSDSIVLKTPEGTQKELFISQNSKTAIPALPVPAPVATRPVPLLAPSLAPDQEEQLRRVRPQRGGQRQPAPGGRIRGTDDDE